MSKKPGLGFLDWVGVSAKPDLTKAKWLGPFVGVAIALVIVALAVAGLATLVHFLSLVLTSTSDHEAIRNIGLAVVAVLGALFVVWRAAVAQK